MELQLNTNIVICPFNIYDKLYNIVISGSNWIFKRKLILKYEF